MKAPTHWLRLIGPGLLVAATGVGAGDLASAAFAGSHLGTAILWAVLVGAFFKFVITEGLMRWQLATGQTLLEGMAHGLGRLSGWLFLPYLLLWSFFVGSALMSACGVTLHAIIPVFESGETGKVVFGILASLVGLLFVLIGGFRLFEKIMSVCIAIMFCTVVVSACLLAPDLGEVIKGLLFPVIPKLENEGIPWTLSLIGGVGGTVTILCYGYWIAEVGRREKSDISVCRIDLGVGYLMTAIFGVAMVIIAASIKVSGSGTNLIIVTANSLTSELGQVGRWMFLAGAFGAVFSSLLGVWQSVPYLFADLWRLFFCKENGKGIDQTVDTKAWPYRGYLVGIALVPMLGLVMEFRSLQKLNGMVGAAFLPLITIVLLLLNGRKKWMGESTNRPITVVVLISILIFFGGMAWSGWIRS